MTCVVAAAVGAQIRTSNKCCEGEKTVCVQQYVIGVAGDSATATVSYKVQLANETPFVLTQATTIVARMQLQTRSQCVQARELNGQIVLECVWVCTWEQL